MSTNITDAWLVPTSDMKELLKLGQELREKQRGVKQEVADKVASHPWMRTTVELLSQSGCGYDVYAGIGQAALKPMVQMHAESLSCVLTDAERQTLHADVKERLHRRDVELLDRQFAALFELYNDIFEAYCRVMGGSIVFVPGHTDNGVQYVYAKGFALTGAATMYMCEHYESFEYTDATEMSESALIDRSGCVLLKDMVRRPLWTAQGKDEAYAVLRAAQEYRGELWEKALGGKTFRDVGLKCELSGSDHTTILYGIINETLETAARNIQRGI